MITKNSFNAINNSGIICFGLNRHYIQIDNDLKKDIGKLLNNIEGILISGKKIQLSVDEILKDIFSIRIRAIKYLYEYIEPSEMFKEAYLELEKLKSNPKLHILAENILFALRCNHRVINSIIEASNFESDTHGSTSEKNLKISVNQLPVITLEHFISIIKSSIPDNSLAQKIIDLTNASLYIEFVILAAVIIKDKQLKIANKIINELAFIVADAAQNYYAITYELEFIKSKTSSQSFEPVIQDEKFIEEQQKLANIGLKDYFNNLVK